MATWPFEDPPNVATFTLRDIIDGKRPILFVTHDDDDGSWQFTDGRQAPDPKDAALVGLGCVLDLDPSIAELADLPIGWWAWRDSVDEPWQREPATRRDDD